MIDEPAELDDACMALCAWFKSQSIPPDEGVMVTEYFIARMIVANTTGPADTAVKFDLMVHTIRELMSIIPKELK